MNEIAIVTFYDEAYKEIGQITEPNKRDYAKRHGYSFYCHTKALDQRFVPPFSAWNKVLAIEEALAKGHKWVFWTDADSAIIAPEVRLESMLDDSKDFLFGCEITGLNTGNFFTQNTARARSFLNELMKTEDWQSSPGQWEQSRFHKAIKDDWHVFDYALLGDYINAPPSQHGGKFIVHCWGMPMELRRAHLACMCNPRALSQLQDRPDLWIYSYFQPRVGRYLEIEAGPTVTNRDFLIGMGWDAFLSDITGANTEWLTNRYQMFNVVGVGGFPSVDTRFDYIHWEHPDKDDFQLWLPWLSSARVISCSPKALGAFNKGAFREIHRTQDISFLTM